MTLGVIMLVHTALDRAEQAIAHWVAGGCPVVVHVDSSVDDVAFTAFREAMSRFPDVSFAARQHCTWGTWGLVEATQRAAAQLLAQAPDLQHVYLASGSCLPLRPVSELCAHLAARPETDFIESSTTDDVPWAVGGLDSDRFTLRFPFSWRHRRGLFDRYVKLQRLVGFKRRIPAGLVPHLGSQWWCLTRKTLKAILEDPRRPIYDGYFRKVWIPDESYFQTLARLHSTKIESRSLTLSKFDYQGKPHIFYDDHLALLRRSGCFVARKIWHRADKLYQAFPAENDASNGQRQPDPIAVDRVFDSAVERRTLGRPGLFMQSRFPAIVQENAMTAAPFSVLQGFAEIFVDFEEWLAKATGADVHGHLFAPDRAHFQGRNTVHVGGIPDSARLRDYNPKMFISNLIWNTRGRHQCFQFGPGDNQDIDWVIANDTNARISIVSGAWAIPLFRTQDAFSDIRREAARQQLIENAFLKVLRSPHTKARVRIQTLADFLQSPMDTLHVIIDEIGHQPNRSPRQMPEMVDLTGFGRFLQDLRNQGMHPFLTGTFPAESQGDETLPKPRKPYLVK